MREAILASFYHECSTDENPDHKYCPAGADSWCEWRKADANKNLKNFNHPPAFSKEIKEILEAIYVELTSEDLLSRCVGANTQNNNESLNACVWNIAPKHSFAGKDVVEIAAFSAACVFNEGLFPILKVMETMGVQIGPNATFYAEKVNSARIDKAEHAASRTSKQHRIAVRNAKSLENYALEVEEGVMYGAGIAD